MKTTKRVEFVKKIRSLPGKVKFAAVGSGVTWTYFEGPDAKSAVVHEDQTLFKGICTTANNKTKFLIRGGELKVFKEKVIATELKANEYEVKAASAEEAQRLHVVETQLASAEQALEKLAKDTEPGKIAWALYEKVLEHVDDGNATAAENDLGTFLGVLPKAGKQQPPQPPPKLTPQQKPQLPEVQQPQSSTKPQPPPKLTPQQQEAIRAMKEGRHEAVKEVEKDVQSEFDAVVSQHKSAQIEDDDRPEPPLKPDVLKALSAVPKSPVEAKAAAEARLKKEEEDFDDKKAEKHTGEKIKKIEKAIAKQEKEQASDKATELAKNKTLENISDIGKQALELDFLDGTPKVEKKEEKKEKSAIEEQQALEKEMKSLDKLNGLLSAAGDVGKADMGVSKTVAKNLSSASAASSADIAADSGNVLSSGTALGTNLANAFTSFQAYFNTKDPAVESQCLDAGIRALGAAATSLLNLAKGALQIADQCGATEVAGAVPILGLVAVLPTLLEEIYDLQDAARRVKKQRKICQQVKDNPALKTTLEGLMDRDMQEISKGMARICLDCTKIAGHAVTLAGPAAAAGPALNGIAIVGKVLVKAGGTTKDFYDAHKANKSDKKLEKLEKEGGSAEDKDHQASKVIQTRPQLAAQILIDQAVLEIQAGVTKGPASKALMSFGIEEDQIKCGVGEGEDQTVNIRNMRQLMLLKLNAEDKQGDTLMQKMDKVEDYLSFGVKHEELKKYNKAKDLIGSVYGGKDDRGRLNLFFKNIKTDDVEEKKKTLLAVVEKLLKEDTSLDPQIKEKLQDPEVREKLNKAKDKLQPNPMEKKDRVLRKLNPF